jgi:hypothetical protein
VLSCTLAESEPSPASPSLSPISFPALAASIWRGTAPLRQAMPGNRLSMHHCSLSV